jgi:hypothetical protein
MLVRIIKNIVHINKLIICLEGNRVKKKYLIIGSSVLAIIIFGAIVFVGISGKHEKTVKINNKKAAAITNKVKVKVKEKFSGNSNGNLMNYGFTEFGYEKGIKYTYFTDIAGQCKIYKVKEGKNEKIKVSDRQAHDICFVNGWLYCRDWNSGYIFKVKPDGTGMQDIIKDKTMGMQVTKDSIYYTKYSDNSLHKIDTNGLNKKDLLKGESIGNINIVGDWIYYYDCTGGRNIYKIKTDGTNKIKLSSDSIETYGLIVKNGWVYYINSDDGQSVYKIKIDGTNKIKLINEKVNCINVTDNYIVYTDKNNIIYRTGLDGKNKIKLSNIQTSFITITDGYIYYTSPDFNKLYRIKIDGSGQKEF